MPMDTPPSSTRKSVWLHKWWLSKVDDDRLAVAGFASGESKGARVFCSAAIAKRHDATTLETTDGIIVTISDSIDRFRSIQNGLSPEVCNQFLFGFPYNWEECDSHCYDQESFCRGSQTEASCLLDKSVDKGFSSLPNYLDDLPATRIRDLIMSPNLVLRKSILDNILGKGNDKCTGTPVHLNTKGDCGECTSTTSKASPERTPVIQKKVKIETGCGNEEILSVADNIEILSCNSSKSHENVLLPREGRVTRSMTRLKKSANDRKNSMSAESSTRARNSGKSLSTGSTTSHPEIRMTRSRSKKMILCGEGKNVKETISGSVKCLGKELDSLKK